MTPLPDPLFEPFDKVATRTVSLDALVAFVATQMEVHGYAEMVPILSQGTIIAEHPRHTQQRLVIDATHYEGRSTERVQAPPPLGWLGRRLLELAQEPVAHRNINHSAALAEVAR